MADTAICDDFDTVVIGGGIVGLCLSWFLAEDGAAVVCLDDGAECGSTSNAGSLHVQMQSRLSRQFPGRYADFLQSLPMYPRAVAYWSELAKILDANIDLATNGGLMVADDRDQMERLARKCSDENRHGVETSLIGRQELLRRAPYLNGDLAGAAFCPLEGKVDPLKANAAIRRKLQQAGGSIRRRVRVERLAREGPGWAVVCNAARYHAARVVIAAGSGSGPLAASLGFELPVQAEPLHMNITDATPPFLDYLLQHAARPITMKQLANGQIVIGGGWPAGDPAPQLAPSVSLSSTVGNLDLAREIVPEVGGLRVVRSWAGINPRADLLSVLGEAPASPGVFVAVPGDAGYTLGPYCARLVADLMAGRPPDFPLAPFSASRFRSA